MDSANQKVKSEADRQYEEDLERARALSLESLALEKFKLHKQQKELEMLQESRRQHQCQSLGQHTRSTEIQERKLSMPQTSSANVQERLELKSRPRPGSFNSG